MIQLLPCPTCRRETVLPVSASLDATICCPHCKESFQLGDLLLKEYGFWEVIQDPRPVTRPIAPAQEAGGESRRTVVQQLEEFADEDFELAPVEPRGVRPVPLEPEKPKDWSKFKPITHEQHERMKRQARSPVWSIFQVVLGGVAAVPIALLILWHGLGRDVMDAGPLVGGYVPWIVPQQFRPSSQSHDEAADPDETSIPRPGESGFRKFDGLESQNETPPAGNDNEDANTPTAEEEVSAAASSSASALEVGTTSSADDPASAESDDEA